MAGEQNECSDFFVNKWDPIFATKRTFNDHVPWKEREDDILRWAGEGEGGDGDGLENSSTDDYEDQPLEFSNQEVTEFMRGHANLADLKSGRGFAGHNRNAWIDEKSMEQPENDDQKDIDKMSEMDIVDVDHMYESEIDEAEYKHHEYGVTTATGIYQRLKRQRSNSRNFSMVDKRLMLFRNVDPNSILALLETALSLEIELLNDAVWKHLAFKPSIGVKNTTGHGYAAFEMEIHIPGYEFRRHSPQSEPRPEFADKVPRKWTDLSFLEIGDSNSPNNEVFGIRQTQFTMFICGWENRRWTGCAFVDCHNEETLEEEFAPYEGLYQDPIVGGPSVDVPIWDPREYYLTVLKARLGKALIEWTALIRIVNRSIDKYRRRHPSTLSKGSEHQAQDAKKTFDWTQQTMELLSELQRTLLGIIQTWNTFKMANGDIQYFSDFLKSSNPTNSSVKHSFRAIRETIDKMTVVSNDLKAMHEDCRNSSQALHLRLTLEANEAVQVNGVFANFTVSIISPAMLAIAYFSIPKDTAPFQLNAVYFYPGVILIGLLIQLLFVIFSTRPSWMRRTHAYLKMLCPGFGQLPAMWTRERPKEIGAVGAAV